MDAVVQSERYINMLKRTYLMQYHSVFKLLHCEVASLRRPRNHGVQTVVRVDDYPWEICF